MKKGGPSKGPVAVVGVESLAGGQVPVVRLPSSCTQFTGGIINGFRNSGSVGSFSPGPFQVFVASLNVPVPHAISQRAWGLRRELTGFEHFRDDLTLVLKRFDAADAHTFDRKTAEIRTLLKDVAPFQAQVDGIDAFTEPPTGPAPVVYLRVKSPALHHVHERLVAELGAVSDIEGEGYAPHITLARGGDQESLDRLRSLSFDPITWTVDELEFRTGRPPTPAGSVSLGG